MKKVSLFLLILSLAACDTEQDAAPGMGDTFVKLIGNVNDDFARDIKPTADGGYIILSENTVELAEEEITKIHLIKTDVTAEEERINLAGKSLQVLENGYMILGDSIYDEESTDLYLMRTDLQGNLLNSTTFSIDGSNLKAQVIEQTNSGTFIIMSLIEENNEPENMSLSEIDANFNELWNQKYIWEKVLR